MVREVFLTQFIFGYPADDIFQPGSFVNAASFAGGKQGVDHGGSLGGIVISAEQIVLPADGKGPDAGSWK